MTRGIINWLFGVFFNLVTATLIVGVALAAGAWRGTIEMAWLSRTGFILQILGVSLFAMEYMGVAQQGQSPLRWWLRRLAHDDLAAPALWPRQMVLMLGGSALLVGLALQLVSSWR